MPAVYSRSSVRRSGMRYVQRHMRRSAVKSAMSVVLAALLFAAMGQLSLMRRAYDGLFADTEVKGMFEGGLRFSIVGKIFGSEYAKNPYYATSQDIDLDILNPRYDYEFYSDYASYPTFSATMVTTNDVARYAGDGALDITYADGYDEGSFERFGNFVIMSESRAEKQGLKPGDDVTIGPQWIVRDWVFGITTSYHINNPYSKLSKAEILELYSNHLISLFMSHGSFTCEVVGIFSNSSGTYDDYVFTPGSGEFSYSVAPLQVAEFTLTDNALADECRSFCDENAGYGVSFVMDTGKLENPKNMQRILNMLYPIAFAAALMIEGFLCCLMILQSSREAAIMRILGTAKGRARSLLTIEQLILCVCGIVLGAIGLLAYNGSGLSDVSEQTALFAALYFAMVLACGFVCSALVTNRSALELLQVRE